MNEHRDEAGRLLDAMPDTVDFRDQMYIPTLIEVPSRMALDDYRAREAPILDQGVEGACTGFGLATVANYLLRSRRAEPDADEVSARMLYEMAKRYDEWPGEEYSGSSARGAMKGWHKHGVCAKTVWPYEAGDASHRWLTEPRAADALRRPLGAYFRVNHKDLVAMHAAIAEVGVLYATARVHTGWNNVGPDGMIHYPGKILGGHAFAIVAYDRDGFWIQNSWGPDWGFEGFAHVRYDDWLTNGTDVWVARLGVPTQLGRPGATAAMRAGAPRSYESYVYCALRPHIVTVGNDGVLARTGTYGLDAGGLTRVVREEMPKRMEAEKWPVRRVLLYAHGGLVGEDGAIQRLADYREAMLQANVYPLCFIWRSDLWTTVTNILEEVIRQRRPEGFLDRAKDFMLDRIDDTLEPVARLLGGKALWDEMKENAVLATLARGGSNGSTDNPDRTGAARLLARALAELHGEQPLELHIAAHSAGAIFAAPLVQLLATEGRIATGPMAGEQGLGLKIASCSLWAPACTTALFAATYQPLIEAGRIGSFALYTLTDDAEQDDDCGDIYHKSLLYLVSHAFEERPRILAWQPGEPLLGLERDVQADGNLVRLLKSKNCEWIRAPESGKAQSRSDARRHGDFDDDQATLKSTLARILGSKSGRKLDNARFTFRRSPQRLANFRRRLDTNHPGLAAL